MIEVNGIAYQSAKMPPRLQFHVLRRLTPLLTAAGPAILVLLNEEKELKEGELGTILIHSIGPISEVLSTLADEQVDYVLNACLQYAQRQDGDKWFPIMAANGGRMYQDIDGLTELKIVAEVVKENLSGFFGQMSGVVGLPLSSLRPAQAAPA